METFVVDTQNLLEHNSIAYGILSPWRASRYKLVSWWDMLEFSGQRFFWCARALRAVKQDCLLGSHIGTGEERAFVPFKDLDEKTRNYALDKLKYAEIEFRKLGLQITADTIKEVIDILGNNAQQRNHQWLMDQITTIEHLANKELKRDKFFYVPAERAKFFPRTDDRHIFGYAVADAFPSAVYDISESGICLALGRGNACVFHLMRVLEIGLRVLGSKFEVSLAHTNWGPAIDQIEKKIREMHKEEPWKSLPDCKGQQEFYAQVASHFGILKDAWRNYTMHARSFYGEEQAELIFENMKAFMQKLATKLSE